MKRYFNCGVQPDPELVVPASNAVGCNVSILRLPDHICECNSLTGIDHPMRVTAKRGGT